MHAGVCQENLEATRLLVTRSCSWEDNVKIVLKRIVWVGVERWADFTQAPPHTFSFNCTVNNCVVRSRVCRKIRRLVQLEFLDCVILGMAEDLTAQFTSDCAVCCFPKAEAQFFHSFNAVNIA